MNELSKQFDNLSESQLKRELETIKSMLCKYSIESVFYYNLAIDLYKFICKRHKIEFIEKVPEMLIEKELGEEEVNDTKLIDLIR